MKSAWPAIRRPSPLRSSPTSTERPGGHARPWACEASGLQRVLADDTFATIAFGTLCLEQGCVEEAAQAFTRILRKDPDNHAARERLETTLHARARRKG